MNQAKFMIKMIELKANTATNISNFLNTYNIKHNNPVIKFFENFINNLFTSFININNQCLSGGFKEYNLTPTSYSEIPPSKNIFTKLSITKYSIYLPTNNIKINNNNIIKKDINLPNFYNKITNIEYKPINNASFQINAMKVTPNIPLNKNTNCGFLPQYNINSNSKFYKILKFYNIDSFKNIYDNYIINDINITNYEVHLENLGNKVNIIYLLIEYLEENLNNNYNQYCISFKANTKKKYQNFLNMKGPIIDPDLL